MKKLFSIVLALALLLVSVSAMADKIVDSDYTVTFMRAENSAIPVMPDVASTRQILERTGVKLDIVTTVGTSDYNTKMMALYKQEKDKMKFILQAKKLSQ